jgi:23S rRNA (cytosine1962-C5)-methyltransferase
VTDEPYSEYIAIQAHNPGLLAIIKPLYRAASRFRLRTLPLLGRSGIYPAPMPRSEGTTMQKHASVTLKPKEELRIVRGHPWIFDNEISAVEGTPGPGDLVECRNAKGKAFAWGWYNPDSKIRVRVVWRSGEVPPAEYARILLAESIGRRARRYSLSDQSVRLCFGEADSLPGLIVDQFVDERSGHRHLSAQLLSRGAATRRDELLDALESLTGASSIVERSDSHVAALEGMECAEGVRRGVAPERVRMRENGLAFELDTRAGQKTGWFLDQRENRAAAASWASGARCLDAFCNLGGFSLALAAGGASSVTAVDASAEAVEGVRANAALNGVEDKVGAERADCFDFLSDAVRDGKGFDLIVLDPPAFAKKKSSLAGAERGYKEINLRAMKLLPRGGILVTCTCSFQFSREAFYRTLEYAAWDAGRRFELVEQRTQAPDHPIVSGYPESAYLKCAILRML